METFNEAISKQDGMHNCFALTEEITPINPIVKVIEALYRLGTVTEGRQNS